MSDTGSWWLVSNRHGGLRRTFARTAVEARGNARDDIAEAFLSEGCSPSAARRGASSYGVWVVAGGCSSAEADAAIGAWDDHDYGPVEELHNRWRASTGLPPVNGLMRKP